MGYMSFSTEKCSALLLSCTIAPGTLVLFARLITCNRAIRDLGLPYSGSLNFLEHTANVVAKARRIIGLLFKTFTMHDSITTLYMAKIRPLLDYCAMIYSNKRKGDRQKLETLQRSFTRCLLGMSPRILCTTLHGVKTRPGVAQTDET
ncbi:unnamed protein product [Dicrocoelium dendriticum]|nr:unnamed protein product [Dicrocoelium dendriticum]